MKISIITPSYNQGKFIRKTLDSVLLFQDYDYFEYIVVDGYSQDGTLEILKEYKDKFPDKFFYIYEKDFGQSNAINKGFNKACGDIIGWINSDDYYENNVFEFVIEFFTNNSNIDLIYGECNIVDENSNSLLVTCDIPTLKILGTKRNYEFNYDILLNVCSAVIPQPAVFFRKEIFKEVGYLDENYHFAMDYEYWLRIGKKCNICHVDEILANYRIHKDAKTNFNNNLKFSMEILKAHKKHEGKFLSKLVYYIIINIVKHLIKKILLKSKII